jgi:hypothetical protein
MDHSHSHFVNYLRFVEFTRYMKRLTLLLLVLTHLGFAQQKEQTGDGKSHYVCIQSSGLYHDKGSCSTLSMCSGGKVRKTKNIAKLKPCGKCVARQNHYSKVDHSSATFSDIKRVLGVKDKKQIADSLGTSQSTIQRPGGFSMRISGPPQSRTVNSIEFYFSKPVTFHEDTLFSRPFFSRLGLQFAGCKADTIRNTTPHPVTGKVKKDVIIEYRGCAIVEARDQYEDTSKYYYELIFFADEIDLSTGLEKIQLLLRVEKP